MASELKMTRMRFGRGNRLGRYKYLSGNAGEGVFRQQESGLRILIGNSIAESLTVTVQDIERLEKRN